MDPKTIRLLQGAAGAAGAGGPQYLEEVFNMHGYHGDGYHVALNSGGSTNRQIVNGLDLTGTGNNEGGMVWIKGSSDEQHVIGTTQLGEVSSGHWYNLSTDNNDAKDHERPNGFKSFNTDGFNIGQDGHWNSFTKEYVAYTFKKAKGFFDIQTWDGDGTDGRTISHNLDGVPGAILVKCTSHDSTDWWMYHRSTHTTAAQWLTHFTATDREQIAYLNYVAPTSSVITLGNDDEVNASGKSYIAFIFAHDDARWGPNEDQSIIKCGYYTGTGSGSAISVDLGFEPAFVLIKNVESNENWNLFDTMRGFTGCNEESILVTPNVQVGQNPASGDYCNIAGTSDNHGFKIPSGNANRLNESGKRHIYIAIAAQTGRNMKAITDPTKVFAIDLDGTNNGTPSWVSGFPVDMQFIKDRAGTTYNWFFSARKNGKNYLSTINNSTNTANAVYSNQYSNGWGEFGSASGITSWMFRRHAGFDVQWYEGNGTARTLKHDLGQVPDMIWTKGFYRNSAGDVDWGIYCKHFDVSGSDPEDVICRWDYNVAYDQAQWNDTAPTSEVFSLGSAAQTNWNQSGVVAHYVAFLFSNVDGICKCGGYSGSTSTVTVNNLGFAPKFILILCYTDNSVEPLVFDTARGLTSGVDCYLQFNSNAAQDCNYDVIDIITSPDGFEIPTTGWINNNGEKYIYYAHA